LDIQTSPSDVAVLSSDTKICNMFADMLARAGGPEPTIFTSPESLIEVDWPGRGPLLLILDLQAIACDRDAVDALIEATCPANFLGVDGRSLPPEGDLETLVRASLKSTAQAAGR
jgi:hypothetical protein